MALFYYNWKLMASIAWNLKLTKENPMYLKHVKLVTPFYRAVNCCYYNKKIAYSTEKDLAEKTAALYLL